jgi:hypothetical protein
VSLAALWAWLRARFERPAWRPIAAIPTTIPCAAGEPAQPTEHATPMSQLSADIRAFGGILSDLFDRKATPEQAWGRLGALCQTISGQVSADLGVASQDVAKIEQALGPQATAQIAASLADAKNVAIAGLQLVDQDLQPYVAAGLKMAEGAVDGVVDAAIPGGGGVALNPLINNGLDALGALLKSAIDTQVAARKAQLAAITLPPPAPTAAIAPAAPAAAPAPAA